MPIFKTVEEVLHYRPTANRFFTGHGGYQIRARVAKLFGRRVWIKELDREDVPTTTTFKGRR